MTTSIEQLQALASRPPAPSAGPLRRSLALTRELAVTQFKLKYTGSVLGYLWSLLKPAAIFGINYAVFAVLLNAGRNTVNFPLQLLFGIVVWSFFAETVATSMSAIVMNGHVIRKAYFPRYILVIAASVTASFTFLINFALVIVGAVIARRLDLQLHSLLAIPLIVELYLLILGLSLILASFFVFYRDLGHIWEIFSQLLFYGSAIVFPLAVVPVRFRVFIGMNPIAQVVEDIRHALVSSSPTVPWTAEVTGALFVVPLLISIGVFAVGVLVFQRLSSRFAESL
jgi:ABC-2 type transport system permease protein